MSCSAQSAEEPPPCALVREAARERVHRHPMGALADHTPLDEVPDPHAILGEVESASPAPGKLRRPTPPHVVEPPPIQHDSPCISAADCVRVSPVQLRDMPYDECDAIPCDVVPQLPQAGTALGIQRGSVRPDFHDLNARVPPCNGAQLLQATELGGLQGMRFLDEQNVALAELLVEDRLVAAPGLPSLQRDRPCGAQRGDPMDRCTRRNDQAQ
mmetsp:Transcript_64068/g.187465  ORF Transcript_64068/g.187465 Transcript_64068/m.187465 type:complete len:214 (+) Transcript_64068:2-643(+)